LTPQFIPTSGFPALSVSAFGFGQSSRTLLARVSSTACNSAVWISDSSVLCKVGHGVGRQLAVSVSASLQVDSLAGHLSFQAVEVSSISPVFLPSAGSTSITIAGSSVGFAPFVLAHRATIGLTGSHTERSITPASGIGANLVVSATVAAQSVSSVSLFSFNAPIASSIGAVNSSSTGSQIVNIFGLNYGSADYSLRSRIGSIATAATFWTSDTSLRSLSKSGASHGLNVLVSQNNDRVVANTAVYSYSAAQPSSIAPSLFATSGIAPISVFGNNFGSFGYSGVLDIGFTACVSTVWTADSSFSCKVPPGTGQHRAVVVSINRVIGTLTAVVDYKGPDVSSIQPAQLSATGTLDVQVLDL